MENRWKLAGIGAALVGTTALATGVTTSYLTAPRADAHLTTPRTHAPLVVPRADVQPAPAFTRTGERRAQTVARVPVRQAVLRTVNCERNDKLIRVGRDGLIGGLLGAAVGAGGGAIADGSKAAGKGAAIGGLAGAAAGSLYGLYENRTACGSAF
jgi:hypothetical protein